MRSTAGSESDWRVWCEAGETMPKFKTIDDLDPRGKTVLLRADLNVPMADGKVGDTTRIERTGPTIPALPGKGHKVVVLPHFRRPSARLDPGQSTTPAAGYPPPFI